MFSDLRQYLESLVSTLNVAVSPNFISGRNVWKKGIYHRLHSPADVASRYDVDVDQNTVNVHNVNHIFRFLIVSCINCTVKTQDVPH